MFLSDIQDILKILSYKEVVEYILPALDIYSSEQEFLKLQFFQKLPSLFTKLLVSQQESPRSDGLKALTEYVFPIISKMMINSEEQVQSEGVEALCKIQKECLTIEEAQG